LIREGDGVGAKVLDHLGVKLSTLRNQILKELSETTEDSPSNSSSRSKTPTLDECGVNLTRKAVKGNLDPVVGREKEIERVIQILGRRTKNNPVLIGEPGVGKTAIAEGLAQRIANRDIPDTLEDKQIFSLDIGLLIAGTKYRGEFEERLKRIMDEIKTAQDIILVIDELHTLIGAGAAEGAIDAANILKPSLSRGELQCIGATTIEEYRKHIEKDAALERRFQPVMVGEPSVEETIEILYGLRARYEKHHKLTISDEALTAAAKLSNQYINDRFLPDKAIDLIDEAGSRVRLFNSQLPAAAQELNKELRSIVKSKDEMIRLQDFEKAGQLRDREMEIKTQISSITTADKEKSKKKSSGEGPIVTEEDIAEIVAAWTSVPVSKLTKDESEKLLQIEDTLHSRIIGQHEAVSAVARAIRIARVGLKNPNRPIASFIFSGPTGVGKTELTKTLASYFFGSEESMVRFDMSEFMERHTVAKLIGSPPGYVGFNEGGQLTEAVRRRPYTIVLFDEVEKAHSDVFNLMLQILEDGRLTDSNGRTVDFKNTLIIMTSNVGSKVIEKGVSSGLGFDLSDEQSNLEYNRIRSLVNEELKQYFRPEFLNRLDEIIVFRQLTKPEVAEIAEIMLKEVVERISLKGIVLEVTEKFKVRLVEEGYNPSYGARPLRRAIMRLLEESLAEDFLSQKIKPGDTAVVDVGKDGKVKLLVGEPFEASQSE
jgi:ATP-dependent Clp protease ATP-binding subunit ClpC